MLATRDELGRLHNELLRGTTGRAGDPFTMALAEDLQEQCILAVSVEKHWNSWGRHFVPSLAFAHELQQCNNFKDPGVQFYGGENFRRMRDLADDVFNTLPAPKRRDAAGGTTRGAGGGGAARGAAAQIDMRALNNAAGGCVDGSSVIELVTGEQRLVSELKGGDVLWGVGQSRAVLRALVEIPTTAGAEALAEVSPSLRLTPHHPVLVEGSWIFPGDRFPVAVRPCEAVYCFVLEEGAPAVLIDGTPVISLGHGIEEGAAKHPYLGSARVLKDLDLISSAQAATPGKIVLPGGFGLRDPLTGLICGIRGGARIRDPAGPRPVPAVGPSSRPVGAAAL